MSSILSDEQLNEIKQRLQTRLDTLREEIRQELIRSDNEKYVRLTSGVNDTADNSVADLLADLELAIIDQHVNEIRAVEAALIRIANRTYGYCIEDDEPIDYARLQANPTASRCLQCQARYEQDHLQPQRNSL
jgi:RNA polymerase-binding protein DksA